MVMKRVAAGPVDEPDIGIGGTLAVIVVAPAWGQQAAGKGLSWGSPTLTPSFSAPGFSKG